jgi:hypothetical protein
MEGELDRRGVTRAEIAEHAAKRFETAIMLPDGTAMRCSFCDRPAVVQSRRWHRLFGYVPIFPKVFACCDLHSGSKDATRDNADPDATSPREPGF